MFYFLDYDDKKGEDQNIAGADYRELIQTCFHYSAYFSLAFPSEEIEREVMGTLNALRRETFGEGRPPRKYAGFYSCTDESKKRLLSRENDLFDWVFQNRNNPEDLIFYREDGSVFFWSETHEGICALCDRAGEDVSAVVSKPGWKQHRKEDGAVYGLPKWLYENDRTNIVGS